MTESDNSIQEQNVDGVALATLLATSSLILLVVILPSIWNIKNSSWSHLYSEKTRFLSWNDVIRQQTDDSCGPAVISTLLSWNGSYISEDEIIASANLGANGISLREFSKLAGQYGFEGHWLQGNYKDLKRANTPLVVHFDEPGHYVIVRDIYFDYLYVADPSEGNSLYTKADFLERWSGRLYQKVPSDGA